MSVNCGLRSCSVVASFSRACLNSTRTARNFSIALSSHKNNFQKQVAPCIVFKCKRFISRFGIDGIDPQNPLSKEQARDLVKKLTENEQQVLLTAIQSFQSEKMRQEYQGQLAGWRWRSKLGRPTKLPRLGDTDPTGSFCPMPEDWLSKKYAEAQPVPTTKDLVLLGLHNALPFIGFGFLDNFIMIVAGDYIDLTIGLTLGISTMAAAALGNTISDVAGIGSAWYVENLVTKVGFKPPPLTPVQLEMKSSRRVANMGRAIGVSLGCLLGMIPLLFLPTADKRTGKRHAKKLEAEAEANLVPVV